MARKQARIETRAGTALYVYKVLSFQAKLPSPTRFRAKGKSLQALAGM
jgi:hypothetical protein